MKTFTITNEFVNDEIIASQAKPEDTEAVMPLLYQTAVWLSSKGSTQWSELLEGKDVHGMADSISQGDVFVFKQKGKLAGVVILLQEPSSWDRDLWCDTNQDDSVYLHRLAINREYSGKQLGKEILRWVEKGIRFPGKNRIRLDCIASNPTLNDFYRQSGYEYKGVSTTGFSKYEKWL